MPDGVSIPGGPVFIGFPQPADVPCDPTGDGWRGPPGAQGVPGPPVGSRLYVSAGGGTWAAVSGV
jgi:hypothetical protein